MKMLRQLAAGETRKVIAPQRFKTFSALLVAILIACGFLLCQLGLAFASGRMALSAIGDSLVELTLRAPAVRRDIAALIAAEILIHALLGVAIWILALAGVRAYTKRPWGLRHWIAGWSIALCAGIWVANAAAFPHSSFAGAHEFVTAPVIFSVTLQDILALSIALCATTVLGRAAASFGWIRGHVSHIVAAIALVVAAIMLRNAFATSPQPGATRERPNVIVIGIDSLRTDLLGNAFGTDLAPNLHSFLDSATRFQDTVTPLGRTFPAWVSILSGKHPVRSGARDALMAPSLVHASPTLAERLRKVGYATAYATDEVRFNNIDAAYGFDRIVAPKIGATDFIASKWADLPLSNLLVNTRVGRWLLPNLYGNRGAAQLYRPATFLDWLDRDVDFRRPTLLAVHLTLAHWPYYAADDVEEYKHVSGVIGADRQFGELLRRLRERGALQNAIVVVLSDHGEAYGLPQDTLVQLAAPLRFFGHGTSVLSATQYQVLLAIARYGNVDSAPRLSAEPASLEDVTPTLLDLLDVAADAHDFDGVSLAEALVAKTDAPAPPPSSRIRFTETGLTPGAMRQGNLAESANLREAAPYFTIDAATGRVIFDPQHMDELLAYKQRAALRSEWLLAEIPPPGGGARQYLLVSRWRGELAIVTEDPDSIVDPRFVELWQAMRRRFGNEVSASTE